LAILDAAAGRALKSRHLPFHANLISLKAGKAVAIDANLAVDEINEASQ